MFSSLFSVRRAGYGAAAMLGAAALLLNGCAERPLDDAAPQGAQGTQNALSGLNWSAGQLAAGAIAAPAQLHNLPGTNDATGGGGLVGAPFWKSNNPEAVTGEGWLMTNGGNAPQRGGTATPLSGPVSLYVSHLNFMGQRNSQNQPTQNRDLYLHIIASNPSSGPVTITGRGKLAVSNQWRFRQTNPALKSAWYLSSEAWTNYSLGNAGALDNVSQTVQSFKAVEIAKVRLPAQPAGQDVYTAEGRYELNVDGGGAYFSAVATFDGDLNRAVAFATGTTAQQAPGNPGSPLITVDESGEAYGREAGIATNSAYYSGDVNVTLPAPGSGYLGLCYNTNARKPVAAGSSVYYQEQSAPFTMRLQSSTRTWAGYGHKYNAKLVLYNPTATQQNVRISLGANPINVAPSGGSNNVLFDAPVYTLVNGAAAQVNQVSLYNNQYGANSRGPQRAALRTVPVPGGGTVAVNVVCYVPGLGFGAGLQLVLEN